MFTAIHPKLPMRNKAATKEFYLEKLGFQLLGKDEFDDYLMVWKDEIQIHFFKFAALDPKENYGQIYIRTTAIELLYHSAIEKGLSVPVLGHLSIKPWGQKEFSLLDPDMNLLTFGENV